MTQPGHAPGRWRLSACAERRRRMPRAALSEGGFTIVEVMVALVLLALLGTAVSSSLRASLTSTRQTRFRQEATSLAMKQLEEIRILDWDHVGLAYVHPDDPLTSDSGLVLLASASGLAEDESLVLCSTGGIAPLSVRTVDDVDYSVWAYITDAGNSVRRAVVLVAWEVEGNAGSYSSSALLSSTSQGNRSFVRVWPDAAVMAESSVSLDSGASLISHPASAEGADLLTNGSGFGPGATVEGDVLTGGTASFDADLISGSVVSGVGTVFEGLSATETGAWRDAVLEEAQGGGVVAGDVTFADETITAPLFVSGSITFSGSVTISGSGPIFAGQSIALIAGADVAADGAYLVADGAVTMSSLAGYRSTDPVSGGVVSFNQSVTALQLQGGVVGSMQGVAYAPFGGIILQGARSWKGSLVAGGSSGKGAVEVSASSGIEYPVGLTPASGLLQVAATGIGTCGG